MNTALFIAIGLALVLAVLLLRGGSPGPARVHAHERADLEHDLAEHLAAGRKIDAIKLYRRLHGVGLAQAKEAVERLQAGPPAADRSP